MIITIEQSDYPIYEHLLDETFIARRQVFLDRLHWDVTISEGRERDAFDDCAPLYVVSVDPLTGVSRGSLRLLPTSGPTMLNSVFKTMFTESVSVSSPLIWECTRFCTHPNATDLLNPHGISAITSELLLGICEVGLQSGIDQIVGVFDQRMVRIYRRAGWSPEVIAQSEGAGHGSVSVGLWDVTEAALAEMRLRAGMSQSVLKSQKPQAMIGDWVADADQSPFHPLQHRAA
jgi:N-acyl-L-homoserine lactone synthetase